MQMPRLSRDAKQVAAIVAAIIVGVPALVILPMIPRAIRESRWEPSSGNSVDAIAVSRDQRILVSSAGLTPWAATSTLWDVTDQARPRRLSVFEGGSPATISPDGATVATNAFGGRAQVALWNVTRPRHPARLAVLSAGLSGALWGEAFSPDGRILAIASTSGLVLWNVADPARPRLLRRLAAAPLPLDNPGPPVPFGVTQGDLVFSPDGRMLASVSGRDQVTVWDVARPARAARLATLAGPHDYFAALTFSPRGKLLAGVTYHGSVLVFRVAGPGRPASVSIRPGLLASARFPGGGKHPGRPCGGDCSFAAAYAAGFTPDGHALTVVIDRPEAYPSTAARDTVFTWQVAGQEPSATSPPSSATSATPSRSWSRAAASWPTAPSRAARYTCGPCPDPAPQRGQAPKVPFAYSEADGTTARVDDLCATARSLIPIVSRAESAFGVLIATVEFRGAVTDSADH